MEIVGCKSTAAAHFWLRRSSRTPSFCPIARLLGCKSGKNWSRWGRFSLSTLQARQPPRLRLTCLPAASTGIGIYTACHQARKRVTAAAPLSLAGWCMHTSFLIARYADWAPVCTPSPPGGGLGRGPAALASSASVPSASRPPSQPSPRGGRRKTHSMSKRKKLLF